jgi:hypothetical protein
MTIRRNSDIFNKIVFRSLPVLTLLMIPTYNYVQILFCLDSF